MRSFIESPRHPSALRNQWAHAATILITFAVAACGGSKVSPPRPTVGSTSPADGATDVPLNTKVFAAFDLAMAPLSNSTFTLKQGTTQVAGTVATADDGLTATFSPSSNLAASSLFTATITTGAKSAVGSSFAADRSWTFTTGTASDTSAPVVSSTEPAANASGVAINARIGATFSKAMDPLSITSATFTVSQAGTPVPGTVTYGPGNTANFTPATPLLASAVFAATLSADVKDLQGNALANAFGWSFATGTTTVQPPTLLSTFPSDGATAVALNVKLTAAFDLAMDPLGATTFTLKKGNIAVAGTVTTGADGLISTFAPSSPLTASTVYTGTITAAARSTAGAAFAADHSWTFTTGITADTTPPVVTSTNPVANAIGVAINTKVAVTFNKPMDPQSITSATFTVKQGLTPVAGTVVYGPGTTARFTATSPFAASLPFTATLSTGVKDLQANALASAYAWTFTTGTGIAKGPAAVNLGAAGNFAILAKAGISTVPTSKITGNIGVSPIAATALTGFDLTADSTNVFSTSTQLVGQAFAANYAVPTPSNLNTAVGNMEAAYTDAAGRPTPDFLELGTGNIGGKTLAPGLYKWTSTVTIPLDVTISGGVNDVWIFQTTGDLTMAAAAHVILGGEAQAKNIFWEVAGKGTFGAGSHFEGILLCKTEVTLQTGATMNGRLLAQTMVALQKAVVTQP